MVWWDEEECVLKDETREYEYKDEGVSVSIGMRECDKRKEEQRTVVKDERDELRECAKRDE